MKSVSPQEPLIEDGLRQLNQAASYLANQACTVSVQRIKDATLRLQFNREVAYYARGIVKDVQHGKKSLEQGLEDIKKEQNGLVSHTLLDKALLGVGMAAGGLQVATGGGVCYVSAGALCFGFGAPLILHGGNNIYENGRNLWAGHSDTQGPIRKVYHAVAIVSGGTEREGNIAYGVADLAGSVFGAGRLVLKPEAWRLFRYVRADYLRGYQTATVGGTAVGLASDGITVKSIREQWGNERE